MLNGFKHLVSKKSKEEGQLEKYQELLEKDPNNVNTRLKLGDLYAKIGDKQTAVKEYTTAAVQFANDGFLVKAIAVNKIIVRLDPSRQEALDRLSDLYFQRGITADPLIQQYREAKQQEEGQEVSEELEEAIPQVEEIAAEAELPMIEPEEAELALQMDEEPGLETYWDSIPLFANFSEDTRRWFQEQVVVRRFVEGHIIFQGGSDQEVLFIILAGTVNMLTKDREGQDTLLDRLSAGDFFGDIALLASERHAFDDALERDITVIAENGCTALLLSKTVLTELVKREPTVSEALSEEYQKRITSDITLARVPLFSYLDPIERRKIADYIASVNVRKGTTVITEGEMGDCMYVLQAGQVGIYTTLMEEPGVSVIKADKADQERLHLATLEKGDFFGEQALITKEPRTATVIALTDVQLLKFTKHDLATVVKQYPRVGTLLKKYHQKRISDTMESLKAIW